MKQVVNILGIVGVVAISVGCGRLETENTKEQALANDSFETNTQADEEAFALSRPIAEQSQQGVIVVERTVKLKLGDVARPAIYPQPPAPTCIVHAGSHLVSISGKYSGGASFVAKVSYPKQIKFSISKKSCKESQLVIVDAQSEFSGLAITANIRGVSFLREQYIQPPKPCLEVSNGKSVGCLPPLPPIPPKPCLEVTNGKSVGCLPPHDPKEKEASIKGKPEDKAESAAISLPWESQKCIVVAGRRNIRVSAPKGQKNLVGVAFAAKPFKDRLALKNECPVGARLKVESDQLALALTSDLVVYGDKADSELE